MVVCDKKNASSIFTCCELILVCRLYALIKTAILSRKKPLSLTLSLIHTGPDRVQLNALATLEAVRNENSCNPVTHTMSSNYLTIAERLASKTLPRLLYRTNTDWYSIITISVLFCVYMQD